MVKDYRCHVYDIDLKSLLQSYNEKIKLVKLSDKAPAYFYGLIEKNVKEYCRSRNIDFNEYKIVVTHEDPEPYKTYLALSLIFWEEHEIRQFLNYHEEVSSQNPVLANFVGIIEFQVVKIVHWSSPFDNSNRLKQIMNWVESKRYPNLISTSHTEKVIKKEIQAISKAPDGSLIWSDMLTLLDISNELFNRGYTKSKHKFYDAIKHYKKIEWLGNIDAWIYLMFALTHDPYKALTTTKGVRQYFHVARNFFDFPNAKSKISENYDFAKQSWAIRNKRVANAEQIMLEIDNILKTVFKNNKE